MEVLFKTHPKPGGLARFMPTFGWLPKYNMAWLSGDIIAGLSVWALMVPQSLGYAAISGVPVQYGLFAAALALLVFPLFTTSRHVVTGPSSAISAVTGAGVLAVTTSGSPEAVQLVAAITILAGLFYIGLAIVKMGWISNFLSESVLTGFIFGIGIDGVVVQLKKITGTTESGSNTWQKFFSWGRQGHETCIKEPGDGGVIWGRVDDPDLELIHSQLPMKSYYNGKPKGMWQHGEPLSSVGNGISMKAIVDLAAKMDFLICMRKDEFAVWNTIKRTYLVSKGIDLEVYHPLDGITERLSGAPAVLYIENWRGQRNPLYLCVAMEKVWKKYPDARLHLYNCNDKRMLEAFRGLIANNKWWPFLRSLQGAVTDVNLPL